MNQCLTVLGWRGLSGSSISSSRPPCRSIPMKSCARVRNLVMSSMGGPSLSVNCSAMTSAAVRYSLARFAKPRRRLESLCSGEVKSANISSALVHWNPRNCKVWTEWRSSGISRYKGFAKGSLLGWIPSSEMVGQLRGLEMRLKPSWLRGGTWSEFEKRARIQSRDKSDNTFYQAITSVSFILWNFKGLKIQLGLMAMLITPGVWYRKNEDVPSAHPRHLQSPLSYRLSWNEPMMGLEEGETSVRWWSRDFLTCSSLRVFGTSENWYWNGTTSPGFPTSGCSFFSYSALPGPRLLSGGSPLSHSNIEIGESGNVKCGWDESNWAENGGCKTGIFVPNLANPYIWGFAKPCSRSLLLVIHKVWEMWNNELLNLVLWLPPDLTIDQLIS